MLVSCLLRKHLQSHSKISASYSSLVKKHRGRAQTSQGWTKANVTHKLATGLLAWTDSLILLQAPFPSNLKVHFLCMEDCQQDWSSTHDHFTCCSLLWDKTSWGDITHTSTHPRYGTHNRPNSTHTTKSNLVTYKSRNDSDSCITKAHSSMGDSSQSWELGAHCPDCSLFQVPQLV